MITRFAYISFRMIFNIFKCFTSEILVHTRKGTEFLVDAPFKYESIYTDLQPFVMTVIHTSVSEIPEYSVC